MRGTGESPSILREKWKETREKMLEVHPNQIATVADPAPSGFMGKIVEIPPRAIDVQPGAYKMFRAAFGETAPWRLAACVPENDVGMNLLGKP